MAMGSDGYLFMAGSPLTHSTGGPQNLDLFKHAHSVVVTDPENFWWVDTHAFDNLGNLWATSNKLNTLFFFENTPAASCEASSSFEARMTCAN